MSRQRNLSLLLAGLLFGSLGCSSYRYMRDVTPEIEQSRQNYVDNNPSNRYSADILEGRIRPGMTPLQVRVSWGDPDYVTAGRDAGVTEIWLYSDPEPSRGKPLYQLQFDGDRLADVDIVRGIPAISGSSISVFDEGDVEAGSGPTKP